MTALPTLTWEEITSAFRIISAYDLAAMDSMKRHQDVRDEVPWLTGDKQPLALLFVSHRWRTLAHPDPDGRDLRAIRDFLQRIVTAVEAILVDRKERLRLVPTLTAEGWLQAEEVARRMVGFGPFADTTAAVGGDEVKRVVRDAFTAHVNDRVGFRDWLARRIGVWLDYLCMPQKPLDPSDVAEFRRSLENLDSLVMSSTLIALRQSGDDYSTRGWCASEFFLASGRSFARGLFVDVDRMEQDREVAAEPLPMSASGHTTVADIMRESYEQDVAAWRTACDDWTAQRGPLVDITPPSVWPAYRDLQGSSFCPAHVDPNPFRLVMEAVRGLETDLIERWLMADRPVTIDLAAKVTGFLKARELDCAETADLGYLGFVVASHGWIEAFRPLFQEGLGRYVGQMSARPNDDRDTIPKLEVTLTPLPHELRTMFSSVHPASAETWRSRLETGPGPSTHEKEVVAAMRQGLKRRPPEFEFQKT